MDSFPVLRGISLLLKILAILVLIMGVLGGLLGQSQLGGGAMLLVWIVAAGYAVGLWAFSELIGVILAIEHNTRQSSNSAAQAFRPAQPISSTPVGMDPSVSAERPKWMT